MANLYDSVVSPNAAMLQVINMYLAGLHIHIIIVVNTGSLSVDGYGAKDTEQYCEAEYRLLHFLSS